MKKLKIFFIALCAIISAANAQLNLKIKNSAVVKYEGGLIIGGLDPVKKGFYQLSTYDFDLKKKKSTEIFVDKLDFISFAYNTGEILVVSRKNFLDKSSIQYKLDTNLIIVNQKSITKDEAKTSQNLYKQANNEGEINKSSYFPGNFLDEQMRGFEPTMNVGKWMVDFKWDNSVPIPPPPAMVMLNEPYAYKGKAKLLILEQKKEDTKLYNFLYQIDIPGKVKQFKLMPWNEEKVFLYVSLWINENAMEEIIYGIDVKNSKVIFKKTIASTTAEFQFTFSNALFDKSAAKLIIAGNYINKSKLKKDLMKSGTQDMEGYFILFMDEMGATIKQHQYPLANFITDKDVAKKINRRAMKIQEILITGKGEYKIIGEELQFSFGGPTFSNITGGKSSADPTNNMTTGAMDYFQSMAFTTIEFTIDGQKSIITVPIKCISEGQMKEWKYDLAPWNEVTSWASDQTMFSTILKLDNATYNSKVNLAYKCYSKEKNIIVYKSANKYISLSSDKSYSIVPIKYEGYTSLFDFGNYYIITDISKDALIINKFSY